MTAAAPAPVAAPSDLAVRCRGVVKNFGAGATKVAALRGVDLEVRRGELMMLVGPSGCGKTTLISVIAGILDRDEGSVEVLGDDVARLSRARLTRWRGEHVGFVFQAFNLIPTLTAAQNVSIPLLILGRPRREALERAGEMLERMGLGDRRSALPNQLSGGQQQRVAIARSLVHEPQLVVCDEPTSSLDHETGQSIMKLLRERAVTGERALVVVTHDARIFQYADRIARMEDGRIRGVEEQAAKSDSEER
jgi:putative ABC transport system ATP-binding protein